MHNQFITRDIAYVGVNDRQKHKFENMLPLPLGVSYNAYLITDGKTALVDTVDASSGDEFIAKIRAVLAGKPLGYLIINHMEPDHSGSIRLLRQHFPDVVPLGRHELRFYLTPMVHWPETMMTLDLADGVLFSGDAFGCFGALNGAVMDADMDVSPYWDEMVRYYANIVGKYGSPVQKALQKMAGEPFTTVCSTHGPVWREHLPRVVEMYDKMSRYEPLDDGVVVAYGSMYGHTERMAEAVAQGLAGAGVRRVVVHNVSKSDPSDILRDIFKYKGLVIGCPTYSNELYPEVDSLVRKLELRGVKGRVFGCFGSFTWAGAAVKRLAAFAEGMGWPTAGIAPEAKQAPTADIYDACLALGARVAEMVRNNGQ